MPYLTYLDLINEVDSFPNAILHPVLHSERVKSLHLFTSGTHTLGYILPSVVSALRLANPAHWTITPTSVSIRGSNVDERSVNMAATLDSWRKNETFKVVSGRNWRSELYSVYSPNGGLYLRMERSAAALFGVVSYGVHMSVYICPTATQPLRIWTPRRNVLKSTFGGMLDNSVAGGIASGMSAIETLVKESKEEASLPASLIREKAKAVGMVSYFYERDERAGGETGLLQPEIQYVYDLDVDESVIPQPGDDEVQDFHLMPIDEIKVELAKGNFKPNCAVVLIDFFIRHGIITPENEPDYIEIVSRLHRSLEFPLARAH